MYWLILLRPYSPSRDSAWSRGTTPVISCMMIEALMYGFTPMATIENVDRPPPLNRSSSCRNVCDSIRSLTAAWSTAGTGTTASAR